MMPTIAVVTLAKKTIVSTKLEDLRFVKPSEMPRIKPRTRDMAPPSKNTSPHCQAETSEDSSRANARASAEAIPKTPPNSAIMIPMVSISLANVIGMARRGQARISSGGALGVAISDLFARFWFWRIASTENVSLESVTQPEPMPRNGKAQIHLTDRCECSWLSHWLRTLQRESI